VIETICGRRSIREGFLRTPLPPAVVDDVVRAGLAAPSSKNHQPWRVHVVTNRVVLTELADAVQHAKGADRYVPFDPQTGQPRQGLASTVAESADVLRQVPLGLFVESHRSFSGGRQALLGADDERRRSAVIGFALDMVGIGTLVQSMWLAACAHGVSGVFMGDVMIAEQTIGERLRMEGDLMGVLALGYAPGVEPQPKALAAGRVVHHA
jgi:nitroreductase